MNATDYTFRLTAYDIDRFLPQVSKALEKRTELLSRKRMPAVWNLTDKLCAASQGDARRKLHGRVFGILFLVVGIILLVPGVMKPEAPRILPIAGVVGLIAALFSLWRSRNRKENPFERSARMLLRGKDALSEEDATEISFFETAMMLPGEDEESCVLYEDFQCVIETADLFLLVFGTRAAVLQKRDLVTGALEDFRNFISGAVSEYHTLA